MGTSASSKESHPVKVLIKGLPDLALVSLTASYTLPKIVRLLFVIEKLPV
jgi:hypothetical protein